MEWMPFPICHHYFFIGHHYQYDLHQVSNSKSLPKNFELDYFESTASKISNLKMSKFTACIVAATASLFVGQNIYLILTLFQASGPILDGEFVVIAKWFLDSA
jgi:hypothetical protein